MSARFIPVISNLRECNILKITDPGLIEEFRQVETLSRSGGPLLESGIYISITRKSGRAVEVGGVYAKFEDLGGVNPEALEARNIIRCVTPDAGRMIETVVVVTRSSAEV